MDSPLFPSVVPVLVLLSFLSDGLLLPGTLSRSVLGTVLALFQVYFYKSFFAVRILADIIYTWF